MILIDTNTVNYIIKSGLRIEGTYYLAPDVKEESELAQEILGRKLTARVKDITKEPFFDEAVYVKYYQKMLNKFGGRSFYNMTGFGDISILALLKTLEEYFKSLPPRLFFDDQEVLTVITEDEALKKKIVIEFNKTGSDVESKVSILNNSAIC